MQKRFIAGAICPKCKEEDKIFVFPENNYSTAECIRCGFTQQAVAEPPSDDVKPAKPVKKNEKSRKVVWLTPQTETTK